MARWVGEPKGVIERVGVPVPALGVGGVRHNGISTDKPPQSRQVPAGIHVDEADVVGGTAQVVVTVAGVADVS